MGAGTKGIFRPAALRGLALVAGWHVVRPPSPPPPAAETGAQCLAQLAVHGVAFELAATPAAAGGCGITNAVRVLRTAIAWNKPAVMSCGLADRLDAFEREAVQPAALRLLG